MDAELGPSGEVTGTLVASVVPPEEIKETPPDAEE